jgi:hypothetical protein
VGEKYILCSGGKIYGRTACKIYEYMVCPKSNENDFFAQRRRARKGKW